jgi:hypothetical protein
MGLGGVPECGRIEIMAFWSEVRERESKSKESEGRPDAPLRKIDKRVTDVNKRRSIVGYRARIR